jgi:2-methylisocitrate lyase-like PEP mutase family enzyme
LLPEIPDFGTLKIIGVARLKLGARVLRTSINAMKNIAEKCLHDEGMQEVTDNPVTSAYLNTLISN